MATVWIPPLMRDLTAGQQHVDVPGTKVRELIDALDRLHPGLAGRLTEDGELRRGITVTVDGVVSRQGLRTPVREDSEVHFLPPIGGGND
jgi:sulfur-carrier protein